MCWCEVTVFVGSTVIQPQLRRFSDRTDCYADAACTSAQVFGYDLRAQLDVDCLHEMASRATTMWLAPFLQMQQDDENLKHIC